MARWSPLKDAFVVAVSSWRLWAVQFLGNAIIGLLFLWWLQPHEASSWQLIYSSVLIVVAAGAALVLHGGTLAYCREAHETKPAPLAKPFRGALRHLLAIAVWVVVFLLVEWLVAKLDDYSVSFPGYLRSEFPAWLRRMISEHGLDNIYSGVTWLLRWVIVPGLLLPFALFCSEKGFRGFVALREWKRAPGLLYWIVLLVAALIGVTATGALMDWTMDPKTATLGAEKTSLFSRLLFAYLLAILSWLLACSMLGRRTARITGQAAGQPA